MMQLIRRFFIASLLCYTSYCVLFAVVRDDLHGKEGEDALLRFQLQPSSSLAKAQPQALRNNHHWAEITETSDKYHRELAIPKLQMSHPFMMKSYPDLTPIVVPEFRLIMITIPKVGCTEWNRLARVMMGHEDDLAQSLNHNPALNGLTYLSDYPLEEAEAMLLDKKWTTAIFVRDPMERLLSAFLDKVNHNEYFRKVCCEPYLEDGTKEGEEEFEFCMKYKGNFMYFLIRTDDCQNVHWSHQHKAVGSKWWPYVDFVGNMDRAEEDARTLLESLKSVHDGMSAWDKYGKTGWGTKGERTKAFLEKDTAPHQTGAKNRLRTFYTRCAEAFVKDRWAEDYENPYFQFHPIKLFHPQVDLEACNFTLEKFKETVAELEKYQDTY